MKFKIKDITCPFRLTTGCAKWFFDEEGLEKHLRDKHKIIKEKKTEEENGDNKT